MQSQASTKPWLNRSSRPYDHSESGARPCWLRIIENTIPKRPTSANTSTDNRNSTISVAYPKLVKSLRRPSKAHGNLYSGRNRQLAQTWSHVASPHHRFATSRWPRACRRLAALPKFRSGGALVDVADRDALYHAMEGRQYSPSTPMYWSTHAQSLEIVAKLAAPARTTN